MHKISRMFFGVALSAVVLSGCHDTVEEPGKEWENVTVRETMEEAGRERENGPVKEAMEESGEGRLPEEVIRDMDLIMSGNLSGEGLSMDRRFMMDQSSEGGEIVRYQDSCGRAVRYQIIIYGEMGRWEENYYFRNGVIYYTGLVENYSAPIYDPEMDIKDREIRQGVLYNGIYYEYDSHSNTFSPRDTAKMPYKSLEELQEAYKHADTGEERFSEYQILAVNGFLLGGYHNQAWMGCDELYPMMEDKDEYKIYIEGQYHSTATGYKEWEEPEEDIAISWGPMVEFPDIPYGIGRDYNIIAYSGRNDLQIEAGMDISPDNKIYQEILKAYLEDTGITETFELTRILKIDMEDDGQDEIFIQAYHFVDPNDQSTGIQFMRRVTDDGVKEYPIPIIGPNNGADHMTIMGFCDLNGDGVKEILMSSSGVGYSNYMVYEFMDGQFTRVYVNDIYH